MDQVRAQESADDGKKATDKPAALAVVDGGIDIAIDAGEDRFGLAGEDRDGDATAGS